VYYSTTTVQGNLYIAGYKKLVCKFFRSEKRDPVPVFCTVLNNSMDEMQYYIQQPYNRYTVVYSQ
jgi:hypothetical protein